MLAKRIHARKRRRQVAQLAGRLGPPGGEMAGHVPFVGGNLARVEVAEDGRGRKLAAGQQVRIVDLSADAGAGMGLFENLHGFESADVFARHLRLATTQHYGVAAREYVVALVQDLDAIRQVAAFTMKAFSDHWVPAGADGQIERVAQRFALVACGGEIAIKLGILPWAIGDALHAAGKCFDAWLAARGGVDAAEVQDGIEQGGRFSWRTAWPGSSPPGRTSRRPGHPSETSQASAKRPATAGTTSSRPTHGRKSAPASILAEQPQRFVSAA
jgi:hypothetical protein